jgi:thiol-disulfide isomerase/thioredoxin
MARSRPALLTVVLSAAAALGYLSYRAWAPAPPAPVDTRGPEAVGITPDPEEEGDGATERRLVERLPEFSLQNLSGASQSIGSWPGKPMLINFWATWCGPCLREIPMLKETQAAHPDLQIVGIAVDKHDAVVPFADKMQFNYPILVGESEGWAAAAKFGVDFYALPFSVFTAADGSVLGVHTGELHAEQLAEFIATNADLTGGNLDLAAARSRMAGRQ